MTNEEIDLFIAKRIYHWEYAGYCRKRAVFVGRDGVEVELPHFCTEPVEATGVAEEMARQGWELTLNRTTSGSWHAVLNAKFWQLQEAYTYDPASASVRHPDFSMAICLAALTAVVARSSIEDLFRGKVSNGRN